jgi:Methyltransferase domain
MKCPGYGLVELLKDKETLVGIEIGCDEAVTSKYLLTELPQLELHSIDPYTEYRDWNGTVVEDRTPLYEKVMSGTKEFGERFVLHKEESDKIVNDFENESLDFVFVDGIHTYDGVISDCRNYYSKVKKGGIFAGHDFTMIPDVNRAVVEFAREQGKEILNTEVDVWYWVK